MYDDKRTTNEKIDRQQKFTVAQKEKLVKHFQQSQPISQREFCRLCKISTRTFRRWLELYGDYIPEKPAQEKQPAPDAVLVDSNPDVTIKYTEYRELQQIKAKFKAVCAICG